VKNLQVRRVCARNQFARYSGFLSLSYRIQMVTTATSSDPKPDFSQGAARKRHLLFCSDFFLVGTKSKSRFLDNWSLSAECICERSPYGISYLYLHPSTFPSWFEFDLVVLSFVFPWGTL
jgi:hypothetical protein